MNIYRFLFVSITLFLNETALSQDVNNLKLKDYHPVSIYKIPRTKIEKAKYPVIDLHSHDYPKSDKEVDDWVNTMNEVGIAKTIILSYSTGARFDSTIIKYARYKDKFEIWCGFDYTGFDKPGWEKHATEELERCNKKGARGVVNSAIKDWVNIIRNQRRGGAYISMMYGCSLC